MGGSQLHAFQGCQWQIILRLISIKITCDTFWFKLHLTCLKYIATPNRKTGDEQLVWTRVKPEGGFVNSSEYYFELENLHNGRVYLNAFTDANCAKEVGWMRIVDRQGNDPIEMKILRFVSDGNRNLNHSGSPPGAKLLLVAVCTFLLIWLT